VTLSRMPPGAAIQAADCWSDTNGIRFSNLVFRGEDVSIARRKFILFLAAVMFTPPSQPSFAGDGDNSGSGNSGGGNSGSGGGGGDSGSGGGGGNSGSGGGDDNDHDSDNDDDNDEADEREDKSGRGKSRDPERAKKAVKDGKAVPVQQLLGHLRENYRGRVLKVDLQKRLGSYFYKVRLLGAGNRMQTLVFDAKTLQRKLF
jgi:hypothetical protein